MNLSYFFILAIIIVIYLLLSPTTPNAENFASPTPGLCASCPTAGLTCRDPGGQTYYSDPQCLDTSKDKFGGLGCIGKTGCRYCGFGVYSQVPCPGHSPNLPIQPVNPSNPPIQPVNPSNPLIQPINPSNPPESTTYKVNLINQCPVTVLAAALGP